VDGPRSTHFQKTRSIHDSALVKQLGLHVQYSPVLYCRTVAFVVNSFMELCVTSPASRKKEPQKLEGHVLKVACHW